MGNNSRNSTVDSVKTNLKYGCIIPIILLVFYITNIITLLTLKILLLAFVVVFIIFPLIFRYSYSLQQHVIFLNYVNLPPYQNYENLSKFGLSNSYNFYLNSDENIKLGVWHILPENVQPNHTSDFDSAKYLRDGQSVVLYNHGNAGSRGSAHRVELYKVLRKHFHVIAYDYRSYGDSSNVPPSEGEVVKDAMFMYKWIANRTTGNIFVWGHSLGSSLTLHSLSLLKFEDYEATGVFLESPFNNMKEEIGEFPLARMFRALPWFHFTVVDPMIANNFTFQSDRYILDVDSPILIMHAKDDRVVPFKLGYKLYKAAIQNRKPSQGAVMFHEFEANLKYGHKDIYKAPDLDNIIKDFVSFALAEKART